MTAPASLETATPMYASFATFVTLLDWLKEMDVLPSQIDGSLWRGKFSGSGGAQLFAGLRSMHLMDGERPTQRLEELARADKETRKSILKEVLREAYGAETVDGLARMTPKLLDDSLRVLGTTDGTHRKALSFFINAAKAAEIPMPMAIQKRARNRSAPPPSRNPRTPRGTQTPKGAAETDSGNVAPPKPPSHDIKALRSVYVEMLLEKAKTTEGDTALLDRIERILGFEVGEA